MLIQSTVDVRVEPTKSDASILELTHGARFCVDVAATLTPWFIVLKTCDRFRSGMRDTTDCPLRSRVIRVRARLGEHWILLVSGLGSVSTWGEERRDLLLGRSSGSVLALVRQGSATKDDRQGFGLDSSHGVAGVVMEAVPRVPERE